MNSDGTQNNVYVPRDRDEHFDLVIETKEKYQAKWFPKNPDITGMGVGYKSVDGNLTNALAIRVSVRTKYEDESTVPLPLRIQPHVVIDEADQAVLSIDDPDVRKVIKAELNNGGKTQFPELKGQLQAHRLPLSDPIEVKRIQPIYHIFDGKNLYDFRQGDDDGTYIVTSTRLDLVSHRISDVQPEDLPNRVGETRDLPSTVKAKLPADFPVDDSATIELIDVGWRITETVAPSVSKLGITERYAIRGRRTMDSTFTN